MSAGINYQPYVPYKPYQMPQVQQPAQYQPAQQFQQTPQYYQNQTPQGAPLSNIPYQPDVLSLSTKPDYQTLNNIPPQPQTQQAQILQSLQPVQNTTQSSMPDSSMQAQMPAPNIQNTQPVPQDTAQNEEKALPSLNIGVVDAPNNASLTPITDDLNARAAEIEQTYLPEIKNNNSPPPAPLGKKPLNAGKLSAGLMFGSLGVAALMLIPKGISKIAKLIKHK